jgi:hypothetical protein
VPELDRSLLSCCLIHDAWITFDESRMLGTCALLDLWRIRFEMLDLILATVSKVLKG